MLIVDILGRREEYEVKASSFPSSPPEATSVNAGDTFAVCLLSQNWEYFKMRLKKFF